MPTETNEKGLTPAAVLVRIWAGSGLDRRGWVRQYSDVATPDEALQDDNNDVLATMELVPLRWNYGANVVRLRLLREWRNKIGRPSGWYWRLVVVNASGGTEFTVRSRPLRWTDEFCRHVGRLLRPHAEREAALHDLVRAEHLKERTLQRIHENAGKLFK